MAIGVESGRPRPLPVVLPPTPYGVVEREGRSAHSLARLQVVGLADVAPQSSAFPLSESVSANGKSEGVLRVEWDTSGTASSEDGTSATGSARGNMHSRRRRRLARSASVATTSRKVMQSGLCFSKFPATMDRRLNSMRRPHNAAHKPQRSIGALGVKNKGYRRLPTFRNRKKEVAPSLPAEAERSQCGSVTPSRTCG